MISNSIHSIAALIAAMIFACVAAYAQSSGDKLYNQGLQLQSTMTVKAQKSAIVKFQSAKRLYDSATKKAQCDKAISVSYNIISKLSQGKGKRGAGSDRTHAGVDERPEATLELSAMSFELTPDSDVLRVTVNTNQEKWTATPVSTSDGSDFLTTSPSEGNIFEIYCPPNNSTNVRTQKVNVTAGDLNKEITVTQAGVRITLDASKKLLEFKRKGGKQKLDIICNAEEAYPDNYDCNWQIIEKPSWLDLAVEYDGGNSLKDRIGKSISNVAGKIGLGKKKDKDGDKSEDQSENEEAGPELVVSKVEIYVQSAPTGSEARRGEIMIGSGEKRLIIIVNQKGK